MATVAAAAFLAGIGSGRSASAGSIYLNDGNNGACVHITDGNTNISQMADGTPECNVRRAADIAAKPAGTLFINGHGTFLKGNLSIDGALDLNSHKLTALSAGTNATDAVNLGQLAPLLHALGGGAAIDAGTGAVTGPSYRLTNGGVQSSVGGALGSLDAAITQASKFTAVTTGLYIPDEAAQAASSSMALGGGAKASAVASMAIGGKARASTNNSIAVGLNAQASGYQATVLGVSAQAAGSNSAAIGVGSTAMGENAVTLGGGATVAASASGGMALGAHARVGEGAANSLALGHGSTATEAHTVSVGNGNTRRKIVNVAAGTLSATSTDAIIGSQLYATNQNVAANAGNILSLQTRISEGLVGLLRQDASTQAITLGGASGGGSVNFAGASGGRVLSGLANGLGDSDAATVAQLKAAGLIGAGGKPLLSLVYEDLSMSSATLGGTKGTVLRNLVGGAVARDSMDAVNGGQLFEMQRDFTDRIYSLNGRIDSLGHHLSGIQQGIDHGSISGTGSGGGSASLGAGADASGAHSTALGTSANASGGDSTATGANAIASNENTTANGTRATASGSNSTALGSGSHASGDNSVALGAHSSAERSHTVSVGAVGSERQITHVAAGSERTDAANWGQVQDAVSGVRDWTNRRFEQLDRRLDNIGAMGAAMAQMAFSAQGVDKASRIGVGVGRQGGQSAVALGYSHQLASNMNLSFGGSVSSGVASMGAGMAFGW